MNGRGLATVWVVHAVLAALTLLPGTSRAASYSVHGDVRTDAKLIANGLLTGMNNGDSFRFTDDPQALLSNVLSSDSTVSNFTTNGGAATALFKGSIGSLKAYSVATFARGFDNFGNVVFNGKTAASAGGDFFDLVTVGGAGLALGTPVSYRVDFSIDGTLTAASSQPSDPFYAYAIASVRLFDLNSGQRVTLDWNTVANAPGLFLLTLATQVGNTLKIEGSLGVAAGVDALSPTGRRAEVDFYHSALYSLTPSVAGLNTVGASGHNFLAPVPEPTTWALLALGLVVLGIGKRHQPTP